MLSTPGPLYNMVCYNTVLVIALIGAGPHIIVILDYFSYMSIHITPIIAWDLIANTECGLDLNRSV